MIWLDTHAGRTDGFVPGHSLGGGSVDTFAALVTVVCSPPMFAANLSAQRLSEGDLIYPISMSAM